MIEVVDKDFQETLAGKNYIVDMHAQWCGPCKALAPILEQVEKETGIPVYKVDIDEHDLLASKYGVRAVPTVIFFKNGEPVETIVGFVARDRFLEAARKLV